MQASWKRGLVGYKYPLFQPQLLSRPLFPPTIHITVANATMSAGKILVVITSHTKLIGSDHPTGWYLPELAHPYYILKEAGYELVAASPKGGEAPLDQASVDAFKVRRAYAVQM